MSSILELCCLFFFFFFAISPLIYPTLSPLTSPPTAAQASLRASLGPTAAARKAVTASATIAIEARSLRTEEGPKSNAWYRSAHGWQTNSIESDSTRITHALMDATIIKMLYRTTVVVVVVNVVQRKFATTIHAAILSTTRPKTHPATGLAMVLGENRMDPQKLRLLSQQPFVRPNALGKVIILLLVPLASIT